MDKSTDESLLHCSALLLLNLKDRSRRDDPRVRKYVSDLARALKRRHEQKPARGYRDEEPATGVFCAFDAGIELASLLRERGFDLPEGHRFEDSHRDLCFQFKYAPGRSRTSDPRGTRYEVRPCAITANDGSPLRPLEFFQILRRIVLSWRDASGAELFDTASEVFLIGARPLPMIEMFGGLQPHDFIDAFPESGLTAVQPQSGDLLFIQLQHENLSEWRAAGGSRRRRSMGGMFTSRVLAPGDSYALEFQNQSEEFDPHVNSVFVDRELMDDPRGAGYICRIHDGFSSDREHSPYRIAMRESFLPGIERPNIVSRFCELRKAEMAAVKFPESIDSIRISRGGITIAELPLKGARAAESDGLVGNIDFDPDLPKVTVRLPFLFFPDIELPRSLLARNVVVEWINEHRQEARHTISFWSQEHSASHRAQCLKSLSGRLIVNAEYLGSGRARAGMDNVLVYRDDFHLDAGARLMDGAQDSVVRGDLRLPFNSVFTGRTPDTRDALDAFVDMMTAMLGGDDGEPPGQAGIAPFVTSRYSFIFREPAIDEN